MIIKLGHNRLKLNLFPTLVFLVLFTLLISLGLWQLDRAEEKRQLLKLNDKRSSTQILLLTGETPDNPNKLRYREVQLSGTYDEEHQFLIDNQIVNGQPGYFVMTPLVLSKSGKAVLVNRGWVPLKMNRSELPEISLPQNNIAVKISGRINIFPSVGIQLDGAEIPTPGWPSVVQVVDHEILSEKLGYPLFGFQVELDPDENNGFVRQWHEARILTPERHQAYAFQWFALAFTLCGLFFWINLKTDIDE